MKARFFRSDAMSERLGETPEVVVEAEWFQLTYDGLRAAPDGHNIAYYVGFEDEWRHDGVAYSDVVLFDPRNPELCPECGQPDNCGDCNHKRAPEYDDGRDVRHEQLRRRLGEDEYLRMEARIDADKEA